MQDLTRTISDVWRLNDRTMNERKVLGSKADDAFERHMR